MAAAPLDPRLLFLPYLAGERLPVVTDAPQGTITGLSTHTTRAQIMRAALEGVALSLRWAFEVLQAERPRELVVVAARPAAPPGCRSSPMPSTSPCGSRRTPSSRCVPGCGGDRRDGAGLVRDAAGFPERRADGASRGYRPEPANAAALGAKATALRALQAAVAGLPQP